MHRLAQRMVDPGVEVVCECAVFSYQPVCDRLRVVRAKNIQRVLFPNALIPTSEHETRVINVMIEVMVREEQVIDVERVKAFLGHLVGRRWTAVEHDLPAADIDDVG
jgi:hypothetical protein